MTAMLSFETLLARVPELNEHTVAPPALQPLSDGAELERRLCEICRAPDAPPRAFAALGNVMVRRGGYVDALEAYRAAADLDPADAAAAWMCAEIAHVLDDVPTSTQYRARALALERVFPDPLPAGARTPVLLLLRDAPYSTNTPLELLLDRARIAVHKYYLEGDAHPPLPEYALAVTAFGSAYAASHAIERAAAFARNGPACINDPALLDRTARERLAATLAQIDGVCAAHAGVVRAEDARAIDEPVLVRPIDTHAGEGFAYAVDRQALHAHLDRYAARRYHVSRFVDYRSADGYYRKARIIFVDGVAYPYHLAIAPQWMVHYQTAPMDADPRLRAQEREFLETPERLMPAWERVMPAIARAVGLEYFGIDATVLPDGRIFVFEADAAMLVHDEDARGVFAYKRPHVARIREALHAAIERRTRRRTP